MYKTYNGWRQEGRVVIAGERGVYRNEYGDYMFHINQTKFKTHPQVRYDLQGRAYVRKYI